MRTVIYLGTAFALATWAGVSLDRSTERTITASFDAVMKDCHDGKNSEVCTPLIVTKDKQHIEISYAQGWEFSRTLERDQTYRFKVSGMGYTARPKLVGKPVPVVKL